VDHAAPVSLTFDPEPGGESGLLQAFAVWQAQSVTGPYRVAKPASGPEREDAMVLIKRVMLAAAMSLLSEGAIAGVMPADQHPDGKPPTQQAQDDHGATVADAAGSKTR
jgi:hypothetical protein